MPEAGYPSLAAQTHPQKTHWQKRTQHSKNQQKHSQGFLHSYSIMTFKILQEWSGSSSHLQKQATRLRRKEQQENSISMWCTQIIQKDIKVAFPKAHLSATLCSGNMTHQCWGRQEQAAFMVTPWMKSGNKPAECYINPAWHKTGDAEKFKLSVQCSWASGLCPTLELRGSFQVKCHLQTSTGPTGVVTTISQKDPTTEN